MKLTIWLTIVIAVFASAAIAGGDPARGKEKSTTCVACHGENGMSIAPTFPNIAGQYEDYLYHSLLGYKNGDRKNAIMAGQVAALTDQDMQDLAAYYASQQGLFPLQISK